jgi:hypothetical protein
MREEVEKKKVTEGTVPEEECEFLQKEFYKRYGIAYNGLLQLRKITKKLGTSLGEIFYLFSKRK